MVGKKVVPDSKRAQPRRQPASPGSPFREIRVKETLVPVIQRADYNGDGQVDISDAATLVNFLYADRFWKPKPPCIDACDANDDGRVDLGDAFLILYYVYIPMVPTSIPPPGPERVGPDSTPDALQCNNFENPCPLPGAVIPGP